VIELPREFLLNDETFGNKPFCITLLHHKSNSEIFIKRLDIYELRLVRHMSNTTRNRAIQRIFAYTR